jgi:hypothetical protein
LRSGSKAGLLFHSKHASRRRALPLSAGHFLGSRAHRCNCASRVVVLIEHRTALWDVLAAATRSKSLERTLQEMRFYGCKSSGCDKRELRWNSPIFLGYWLNRPVIHTGVEIHETRPGRPRRRIIRRSLRVTAKPTIRRARRERLRTGQC